MCFAYRWQDLFYDISLAGEVTQVSHDRTHLTVHMCHALKQANYYKNVLALESLQWLVRVAKSKLTDERYALSFLCQIN